MDRFQEEFIIYLVETGALKFGKFRLSSGRASPYYINLAKAMNDGRSADLVSTIYLEAIRKAVTPETFDYIYGPAYKGIPLASSVAQKLWLQYEINVRWGYDRKEEKRHGDKIDKILVGDLRDGDKVLIVDDVISSGGTVIKNWRKLRRYKKLEPAGLVLVAIDREELTVEDRKRIQENNLRIFAILKITEIFNFLLDRKIDGKVYVTKAKMTLLKRYLRKYRQI